MKQIHTKTVEVTIKVTVLTDGKDNDIAAAAKSAVQNAIDNDDLAFWHHPMDFGATESTLVDSHIGAAVVEDRDADTLPPYDLEAARRDCAEQLFAEHDFGIEIKETSGWEIGGNEWTRVVYFENEETPDGPSVKGAFRVNFALDSIEVQEAWSTYNGAFLAGDTSEQCAKILGKGHELQTKLGLPVNPDRKPLCLSNASAENVWGSRELLGAYGLSWQDKGDFYPLTETEAGYVGDDTAHSLLYAAMLGFTALYQGRKWLMPVLEYPYHSEYHVDVLQAQRAANRDAAGLRQKVMRLGGKVFVKEDAVGAFAHVQILLPFELAQSVAGDFEAWKRFVENEILAQDEYQ